MDAPTCYLPVSSPTGAEETAPAHHRTEDPLRPCERWRDARTPRAPCKALGGSFGRFAGEPLRQPEGRSQNLRPGSRQPQGQVEPGAEPAAGCVRIRRREPQV